MPVGNSITFLQSSNIRLTKDKKAAITCMQDLSKLFCTILQVTAHMVLCFPKAAEEIKDITTITLMGMHTLLCACD